MNEVLVTGIGPVAAVGIGREAWLRGLTEPHGDAEPAGEPPTVAIRDFRLETILPSIKTYLDRASEFALAAAHLALADAGLAAGAGERWRAGVVMGSEFGCLGTMQTYTSALQQKGARLANPLLFSHMYVNTPASLVAIEFGLGGYHGAFAGTGAGRHALDNALEALQLGRADLLVALGVDAISEPLTRALTAEGALGDDALGEGACALVLETAAHAAARGAAGTPLRAGDADDVAGIRAHLGRTHAAEPFFALALRLATVTAA